MPVVQSLMQHQVLPEYHVRYPADTDSVQMECHNKCFGKPGIRLSEPVLRAPSSSPVGLGCMPNKPTAQIGLPVP
jgi:hypothetical protein